MKKALALFKEKIRQQGIDAAYITDAANIRYLSDYTGTDAYLYISAAKNCLITDHRFTEQAAKECADFEIIPSANTTSAKLAAQLCMEEQIKTLSFEKTALSYGAYEKLKAAVDESIKLLPTENITADIRCIKTAEEIELLRYACAATDKVFEQICGFLRPGISEKEVERRLLYEIMGLGCESSFPIIVASGANGSLPHAVPGEKLLAEGEFVTMDFGCAYKGYHADMTRTVFIGRPDSKAKQIYDMVLEAKNRAGSMAAPGVLCCDVDAAARGYFAEKGFGEYFKHGLGHGVGLEIHEAPTLNPSCKKVLEQGNAVTIEPGLYLTGWGGVRIEDTVLITADGSESLFSSPTELIMLG